MAAGVRTEARKNGKVTTGSGASSSERTRGLEAAEASGERQLMSTTFVDREASERRSVGACEELINLCCSALTVRHV
jgi:hypothetical protein